MTTTTPQTPVEALRTILERLTSKPPQKSRRAVIELAQGALEYAAANLQGLDLTAVPDADINREFTRRIGLKRDPANMGRKKILRPCHLCGNEFGSRELRAHIPLCRQTAAPDQEIES